jgi:hypothetical protein
VIHFVQLILISLTQYQARRKKLSGLENSVATGISAVNWESDQSLYG